MKLQCAGTLSDMQAFKAANPGAPFDYFLRWFSPSDVQLAADRCPPGRLLYQLSPRMQLPGTHGSRAPAAFSFMSLLCFALKTHINFTDRQLIRLPSFVQTAYGVSSGRLPMRCRSRARNGCSTRVQRPRRCSTGSTTCRSTSCCSSTFCPASRSSSCRDSRAAVCSTALLRSSHRYILMRCSLVSDKVFSLLSRRSRAPEAPADDGHAVRSRSRRSARGVHELQAADRREGRDRRLRANAGALLCCTHLHTLLPQNITLQNS